MYPNFQLKTLGYCMKKATIQVLSGLISATTQLSNMNTNINNENTDLVFSLIKKFSQKDYTQIKNVSIDIKSNEASYKLIRLNDEQYSLLSQNTLQIDTDYDQLLYLNADSTLIYPSFSRMYVSLKSFFGESGRFYDDWKGSFSFPFVINFQKGEEEFSYLLNISSMRSCIECRISKLILADDVSFDRGLSHNPFNELPRQEIKFIINYLAGFLTGYFKSIAHSYGERFFKVVGSNHILYGFNEGRFFDNYYETQEEFYAAIEELKS